MLPAVNEIVNAVPTSQTEIGIMVKLPDYNDAEAMILLSECSRKHINQAKIVKLMKAPVHRALVLRVDPDRGYIDLSLRRVTASENE